MQQSTILYENNNGGFFAFELLVTTFDFVNFRVSSL